jgi:nicotinamidase-related amidase
VPELGREAEYHFIGLGRRAAAEAKRRVEENLAPALYAARAAGLTVIHCNSDKVVQRYPECLVEVPEDAAAQCHCTRDRSWPPAQAGQEVITEYLQYTWGIDEDARWNAMRDVCDFPAPVRPVPGDFCVYQQAAFDQVARERKITTLIYAGFLLAHCLMDKSGGLRSTAAIWNSPGYRTLVLRDCTLAQESAESIAGFGTTEAFIFWLEATTIPTATAGDFIGRVETCEQFTRSKQEDGEGMWKVE